MTDAKEYQVVLDMLLSEETGLISLASMTGRDVFDFYRSADLRGLCLAGQDLRGLNFENADLRSSDLSGITYDVGAFNGGLVDEKFGKLIDEFDGYLNDLLERQLRRIYFFVRFRSETLEKCFEVAGITYQDFARLAGINLGTLRKARKAQPVARATALAIASTMADLIREAPEPDKHLKHAINQPFVCFLELEHNGSFSPVLRKKMLSVIEASRDLDKRRFGDIDVIQIQNYYSNGPSMILWLSSHQGHIGSIFPELEVRGYDV